jgi:hypothetical protein
MLNGPISGWTIRAVRYKSLDITDSGMDLEANGDIDGIDVELTNRLTTISGSVTSSRNEPVSASMIVVFPQDPARWVAGSRYFRTSGSDRDGRFTTTGIPPGEYYIVALERADGVSWTDPDFLGTIRSDATSFSITEGETKTLDLKVTSGS